MFPKHILLVLNYRMKFDKLFDNQNDLWLQNVKDTLDDFKICWIKDVKWRLHSKDPLNWNLFLHIDQSLYVNISLNCICSSYKVSITSKEKFKLNCLIYMDFFYNLFMNFLKHHCFGWMVWNKTSSTCASGKQKEHDESHFGSCRFYLCWKKLETADC